MAEIKYPVLEKKDDKRVVKVPLREYTFQNSCFPTSVKSMGKEILNGLYVLHVQQIKLSKNLNPPNFLLPIIKRIPVI